MPAQAHTGQRQPTTVQRRPAQAHTGQRQPTTAQRRPTQANTTCRRINPAFEPPSQLRKRVYEQSYTRFLFFYYHFFSSYYENVCTSNRTRVFSFYINCSNYSISIVILYIINICY